jgi:macrolide-specific efflux system membrane fusion protein
MESWRFFGCCPLALVAAGNWLATMLVVGAMAAPQTADEPRTIEIPSAVVKIAEEAAVPSSEAGAIARLAVREGQMVEADAVLAELRDTVERLTVERAELEAEIAAKRAASDVSVQYAMKSSEVARAELKRSEETNTKYPKTVSDTELNRQRLVRDRGELEVKQAEREQEIAVLTRTIRENEKKAAEQALARRTIRAPLAGMVVELPRRRGEWVQPGETVARVVRLDRLRVEGFLAAKDARLELVGREVVVRLAKASEGPPPLAKPRDYRGRIVFVSPEIDPINDQVRIWAEVDNRDMRLRPGMQAALILESR